LEEDNWASWRRELNPRWNWDTWFLTWILFLELRTLGLKTNHVSVIDPEVYMAEEGVLENRRPLEEESYTHLMEHSMFNPCLLDVLPLELGMCELDLEFSTCGDI
jgi:hypothetical protein